MCALDAKNSPRVHHKQQKKNAADNGPRVRANLNRMSDEQIQTAPTLFLLMAQYNGQTVVSLDRVCRDFFGHLTVEKLLRKALRGDIALPIVRIETSPKRPNAAFI